MVSCLANCLPALNMVKDMDARGKVAAIAFMVPASFVLGDHLAYASANIPEYMMQLILTKLVGGVLAVMLALMLTREKE